MARVTFVDPDGVNTVVENGTGSLMEIARLEGIAGIHGDCGGVCSCSTCHVKVHPDWISRVGQASEIERDLFEDEELADERSRLSCQIEMSGELDGLVVEVVELL